LTALSAVQYRRLFVGALIVVTTVGTEEEANQIAEEMVARRHSACVNIVPIHRSVYRWQGKICDDREYLLIIKSLEDEYEAIEAAVRELHSYDLPEILAFRVSRGEARFLDWIAQSLDKEADFGDDDAEEGPLSFPETND
jgi:periplasmic divalent cation tolerance protein